MSTVPADPYDYDAPRIYARVGDPCFYGEPFISLDPGGSPVLVIEHESGCPKVRPISHDFAAAWEKEFGADGREA